MPAICARPFATRARHASLSERASVPHHGRRPAPNNPDERSNPMFFVFAAAPEIAAVERDRRPRSTRASRQRSGFSRGASRSHQASTAASAG